MWRFSRFAFASFRMTPAYFDHNKWYQSKVKTGVHLGGFSSSRNLFDDNEDFGLRNFIRVLLYVETKI